MVTDSPTTSDLHAEVRLWVEWARGAAGPWLVAETPPPSLPTVAVAATTTSGGSSAGASGGPARPAAGGAAAAGREAAVEEAAVQEVPPTPAERDERLAAMAAEVAACTRCVLAAERTCAVFGEGSHSPKLVIVGEAPGAEEDRSGRPFVGAAGQLLTKMLAAIGLAREDVYICNLLKCRPPGNRNPRPDEVSACKPFLGEQLRLLRAPLVLTLGSPATRELLQTRRGIMSLRGRFSRSPDGYRVMPTFHPAYLLRRPEAKRDVWNDLKKVAADLGLDLPQRGE